MPDYKAPLRDIRFLVHNVLDYPAHYQALGFEDVTADIIDPVLEEGARFTENVLNPTRVEGDQVGSKLVDGGVITPPGYREAWKAFREGEWNGLSCDPEFGGQGLPHSLGMAFHDMAEGANMPWCPIFTLTQGAIRALEAHGSDELKARYLPKMVSGEWTGTMALTEAHAGSDLGMLRTRAEDNGDGTYAITGNKIFITWADQDITDNIVNLVLAKLPDAPAGPKGISLFLVPKYLPDAQGNPGERNGVSVASLEEKMGLKSSPTCVFNLDGATGWLVGKPHNGLAAMFTMMNAARLDVAFEGLGYSQLAMQGAVEYALERLQMRAPTGAAFPDKPADPIIVHPDVRRMLLTQKALVEGNRALGYYAAMQLDSAECAADEASQQRARDLVALLIPICKSFFTDRASEIADLGIQVFGGHGYVQEYGMEQIYRDVRITRIYEGTNGIQAIDLMRRKTLASQRKLLDLLLAEINDFCDQHEQGEHVPELVKRVRQAAKEWSDLTDELIQRAGDDANAAMAAASAYLDFAGYTVLAWCWARMAVTASRALQEDGADRPFLSAKVETARFYFDHLLPRCQGLRESALAGADSLMALDADQFWMP
jgi:alkylation response protein AidB-like acyl-CoA dehydrogenase